MTTSAATELEEEVNDPTTIEMKRFTRQEANALIGDLDLTMNKYEIYFGNDCLQKAFSCCHRRQI